MINIINANGRLLVETNRSEDGLSAMFSDGIERIVEQCQYIEFTAAVKADLLGYERAVVKSMQYIGSDAMASHYHGVEIGKYAQHTGAYNFRSLKDACGITPIRLPQKSNNGY